MSKDETLIIVMFWAVAVICIYKAYLIYKQIKTMKKIKCVCSNTTLRTTYKKNIYVYFYTYKFKGEEYGASDETKFRWPGFNPKIKDELVMYIGNKNPANNITPLELFYYRLYILISICTFILPFLII